MKISNKGFSLVELAIALGLIAVLISVVTAGSGMMTKSRVHREMIAIDNLRVAAQNFLSSRNMTYKDISIAQLKDQGLLPANFDPIASNSFGGDYMINADSDDPTRVEISLANIPQQAGENLTNIFKNKANDIGYDESTKTWKAIF